MPDNKNYLSGGEVSKTLPRLLYSIYMMNNYLFFRYSLRLFYFFCFLLLALAGCSSADDPIPNPDPGEEEQLSLSRALADLSGGEYKVWLCAHRGNTWKGASDGIPENSLPAISYAIESGTDIVEIDVRCTSDGKLVVMHDNTVDRTTSGTGSLSSMTLEDIRKFSLRDNDGVLTTYKVPTLEEVLLAGKGKVFFNLDIANKNVPVSSLADLLKKLNMTDQVLLYVSTDRNLAYDLIVRESSLLIHPMVQSSDDILFFSRPEYNVQVMQLSYTNAASGTFALQVADVGAVVFSNITGNNDRSMLSGSYSGLVNMINKRVRIIQTDYTEIAAEYLTGKGLRSNR